MLLDDVPYRPPVILLNLCFASIPFGRPDIFRHTMLLWHGTLTWWFGCKTGEGRSSTSHHLGRAARAGQHVALGEPELAAIVRDGHNARALEGIPPKC